MDEGCAKSGRRLFTPEFITDKYIYLMLLVFPLFTGFQGYLDITASKFLFFLSATLLWLFLLLVCLALRIRSRKTALPSPRVLIKSVRPAQWAVLAFAVAACVSSVFSPYGVYVLLGSERYEGLVTILLYTAIFFGVSGFGKLKHAYVTALAISVTVCCIIAVLQLFDLNALWLFPHGYSYYDNGVIYSGKYLGTIGNTNLLASFLCLAIPLFCCEYITGGRNRRLLLLIPAGLALAILIISRSTGGLAGLFTVCLIAPPVILKTRGRIARSLITVGVMLAFAAAALSYTPTYANRTLHIAFTLGTPSLVLLAAAIFFAACGAAVLRFSRGLDASPRYVNRFATKLSVRPSPVFAAMSVLVLALVLIAAYNYKGGDGTFYELSRVLHGDVRDEFGSNRIRIWRESFAIVNERPLIGGGPDTLALRIDVLFTGYIPETGETRSTYADNAHNEFLGFLVNLGFFGLYSYLAAMLCSAAGWIKRSRESSLVPALGCSLVCYWAQSFFGIGQCIVLPLTWLLWGLLESYGNRSCKT